MKKLKFPKDRIKKRRRFPEDYSDQEFGVIMDTGLFILVIIFVTIAVVYIKNYTILFE